LSWFFHNFLSFLCIGLRIVRVQSESPRPIRLGAVRVGGRDRDFEPCLNLDIAPLSNLISLLLDLSLLFSSSLHLQVQQQDVAASTSTSSLSLVAAHNSTSKIVKNMKIWRKNMRICDLLAYMTLIDLFNYEKNLRILHTIIVGFKSLIPLYYFGDWYKRDLMASITLVEQNSKNVHVVINFMKPLISLDE